MTSRMTTSPRIDVSEEFASHVLEKYSTHNIVVSDQKDPDRYIKNNGLAHYLQGASVRLFRDLPVGAISGFLRFVLCCLRKTATGEKPTIIDLDDEAVLRAAWITVYFYFS